MSHSDERMSAVNDDVDSDVGTPTTLTEQSANSLELSVAGSTGLQRTARKRKPGKYWLAVILTYTMLLAGTLLMIVPFLFSLMTALKTPQQFNTESPLTLPSPFTFENFQQLFTGDSNFLVPVAVTAQVVIVLVIGQMTSSVLAAYAFALLRFPGRTVLFWMYLATMMVPAIATMVPMYVMMSEAGLRNTFLGIVLPFLFGSPYAVFLLRQNFMAMPSEILDAARLDGAGVLRRLWSIVLPMNMPILATLLLITVVSQWNNYLWPSMIAPAKEWNVLTVATASLQTQYSGNWTLVMAATTLALAPLIILFLVFQRQIVRSIGVTGLK